MNAITLSKLIQINLHRSKSVTTSILNRAALASGIADGRMLLQEIEAAMDQACEAAVRRTLPKDDVGSRIDWNRHAWAIYTAEAIMQGRCHGTALTRLRREIDHLQHLAQSVS